MAGLKAAPSATTFPDINGSFFPDVSSKYISDWFNNKLLVHFVHRTLAYLICIGIFIWYLKAKKISDSPYFNRARGLAIALVFLQVTLGILTVINGARMTNGIFGVYEWFALLHQLTGMSLLLTLIALIYLCTQPKNKPLSA